MTPGVLESRSSKGGNLQELKRCYASPVLAEYGKIATLTLGVTGSLPDVDTSLNVVNDSCVEQTFGGYKTVFCVVAGGGQSV